MSAGACLFLKRKEQSHAEDLFAEVALVQFGVEDCLVEMLELRKSELLGQQLEPDRLIPHLSSQALQGSLKNIRVVECERWWFGHGEPGRVAGIGRAGCWMLRKLNERVVGDADNSLAWVALHRAEGIELLQEDVCQPCLLHKFPACGFVDGFIHAYESTG